MSKRVIYLTTPVSRQTAIDAIREAPDNYRVEIRQRTRSLDQNAMLHSLLGILSKTLPWAVNGKLSLLPPEEWKALLSASVWQEQRMAMGVRGGFVMLGRSTSKMTISEMGELIEFTIAFATEQGVNIEQHRKTILEPSI